MDATGPFDLKSNWQLPDSEDSRDMDEEPLDFELLYSEPFSDFEPFPLTLPFEIEMNAGLLFSDQEEERTIQLETSALETSASLRLSEDEKKTTLVSNVSHDHFNGFVTLGTSPTSVAPRDTAPLSDTKEPPAACLHVGTMPSHVPEQGPTCCRCQYGATKSCCEFLSELYLAEFIHDQVGRTREPSPRPLTCSGTPIPLPHEIEVAVATLLEEGKGESLPEGWIKNNGELIYIGGRNTITKRSRIEVTVKKVALPMILPAQAIPCSPPQAMQQLQPLAPRPFASATPPYFVPYYPFAWPPIGTFPTLPNESRNCCCEKFAKWVLRSDRMGWPPHCKNCTRR